MRLEHDKEHSFSRASAISIFAIYKQRGKKILCGQHLYKKPKFDFDFWQCDLNIIRGHLSYLLGASILPSWGTFQQMILTDSNCTIFQKRGQEIWSGSCLIYSATDSCKTNCLFFFKGQQKFTLFCQRGHNIFFNYLST